MMLWQVVPGAMLSRRERFWLVAMGHRLEEMVRTADAAASDPVIRDPLIVNIGVYKGASMHCLRKGAPGATLVGIDVGVSKVHAADVLRAELICQDSRQVAWDRQIDLLFVDGGHTYEVVRSDIERFGPHVVAGGIMAVHDYARSTEYLEERASRYPARPPLGVRKAVDELCTEDQGWEVLAIVDSIKAFRKVGK